MAAGVCARVDSDSHLSAGAVLDGPVLSMTMSYSRMDRQSLLWPLTPTYGKMGGYDATTSLNTTSVFIDYTVGMLSSGVITDRLGRRPAIFWGSVAILVGVIIQTAAQNIAMFAVGRRILGFGSAISGVSSGVYLSETFPNRWRAWGSVGALIAAGVTLRTGHWQSMWVWRLPSLIHGVFSVLCICMMPFVPESPRWLGHEGHSDAARNLVAQTNSNGNADDPVAVAINKEILDSLAWEKEGRTMSPEEIIKTPSMRRRFLIGMANLVLNVWYLVCALVGTHLAANWGRKPTTLVSEILFVVCLFLIGGLSKMYAGDPINAFNSLVYRNVAVMFLFQEFYSVAWTPLLHFYPPGMFSANGLARTTLGLKTLAYVFVFIMPIGLHDVRWKRYMISGSWDIVIAIIIATFWVETEGRTLEEIDATFEGERHSPDPEAQRASAGPRKEALDVGAIDTQSDTSRAK
ncbi:putative hexose carrier protein [Durotheca rogersii]|uniref:putative hexose carrier protein n=1 Tax=Durotheca rogersii TaxID=419775 RepID=UPI00222028A5|nr:putative hexose carrier protein [Durotheca rogersii]KAI5863780.1 putative hexose carrier protein [Durotheca rogersii]